VPLEGFVIIDEQSHEQAQLVLELKLAKVERAFASKQISVKAYQQQCSQLRRSAHEEALAKGWIWLSKPPHY
jgi:hypothetical protein